MVVHYSWVRRGQIYIFFSKWSLSGHPEAEGHSTSLEPEQKSLLKYSVDMHYQEGFDGV